MDWERLSRRIPWVPLSAGRLHSMPTVVARSTKTGALVEVRQPGVHANETRDLFLRPSTRPGGDFVVEVTDPAAGWSARQFGHKDLFADFAAKCDADESVMKETVVPALIEVIAEGTDPLRETLPVGLPGLQLGTLLVAAQCLALCEHRRYPQYEPLGGRALPARFVVGIAWHRWPASEAMRVEHSGRRGLVWLRENYDREPSFSTVLGRGLRSPACREDRDRTTP
jgi:hypothetical protein